jgi:hypothetical protein
MVAIARARLVQVGKEGTRGNAVAATRRLLLNDATYRIQEDAEEFAEQMHGVLSRAVTPPVIVRNGVEFEITNNLDFEQILLHLLSGLKGGVSPTTPGTGDARLWTFTPVNADPVPDTYTVEFADRDLAGTPNEIGLEAPYCFTTALTITGAIEGMPEISASMVGRKVVTSTPTASLALPATSYAGNLRWKVYIDDTWAGLGGSQVSGQIYGFTWALSELLFPQYYLDGNAGDDFSGYEYKPKLVDLAMDIAIEPNAGILIEANEPTDKRAGTKRFIRIEITGDAFDSPDDGLNRFVQLDGCYTHAPDSIQERGGERDGAAITRLHLQNFYDATQGDDITVAVQNVLTAFP